MSKRSLEGFKNLKWKSLPKLDLEELEKEAEEKKQQKVKELEALSKPLYELIVSENFLIEDILGQSYAHSFTPISEVNFEGKSPRYDGGYSSDLVLKVLPERDIPIKTLFFSGFFPGLIGNKISAKIPRYEKRNINEGYFTCFSREARTFYLDRDFNDREEAIELAILSPKGKILRLDRAVGYGEFMKR